MTLLCRTYYPELRYTYLYLRLQNYKKMQKNTDI